MSSTGRRSSRTRPAATRPPAVLIFGESDNDRRAIRELILALCPRLDGYILLRQHPLVLIKDARPQDVPSRAQKIADIVSAESRLRGITCVFVHEDCDAVEPRHEALAEKIEQALAEVGCHAHAVVPAWEIEAWWFLWPQAVTAYQVHWSLPARYKGTRIGLIVNAKEQFRRSTVAGSKVRTPRRYRESDSPLIAQKVRELGIVRSPEAVSASFERFTYLSRAMLCHRSRMR